MTPIEEARARMPLRAVIVHYHQAPPGGEAGGPLDRAWKQMVCPWCQKKKAGVFRIQNGVELFKCMRASCPSDTAAEGNALNEIGYIAKVTGLANSPGGPAYQEYLKIAGVGRELQRGDRLAAEHEKDHEGYESLKAQVIGPVERETSSQGGIEDSKVIPLFGKREEPEGVTPDGANASPETQLSSEAELGLAPLPATGEADLSAESGEGGGEKGDFTAGNEDGENGNGNEGANGGGGGGDGPPGEEPGEEDEGGGLTGEALNALREFYRSLVLTESDEKLLWEKRGLTGEACQAYGPKSNLKSNLELLLALREKYELADLLACGLWAMVDRERGVNGEPGRPEQQFYGWGRLGKRREPDGKEVEEWGWCHPILIPYFDAAGEVIKLRPHKGGEKGGKAHVYFLRTSKEWRERPAAGASGSALAEKHRFVLVVEGEFKAAAVGQALGLDAQTAWGVLALPGITMAKYWLIAEQLRRWFAAAGVERVVVGFDSEEKGDPKLPNYKPDKRKRYESVVWARYTAEYVSKMMGPSGRVATLPKEWRENGKADWDGALARMLSGKIKLRKNAKNEKTRIEEAGLLWPGVAVELRARIREAFLGVLNGARSVDEDRQSGLFDPEEERIIKNKLAQLWYVPELPHGGDKEFKLAEKLKGLGRRLLRREIAEPPVGPGQVLGLAATYRSLLGWYYVLTPLNDKARGRYQGIREAAWKKGLPEVVEYCDIVLKGLPKRVGDFKMDCMFTLVKLDGTREKLVHLRNTQEEETGLVGIDSDSLSQPKDFRVWLLNHGNYTWMTGERELQALQRDTNYAAAFQDVYQVAAFGWHEESKLWFAADLVIGPNGEEVAPDQWGIFWWGGLGYMITEKGKDNQSFRQGRPLWRPEIKGVRRKAGGVEDEFEVCEEEGDLRGFFRCVVDKLGETMGVHEALMAVSGVLAYSAAPEIIQRQGAFPGLWLHGEKGSGKSKIVSWLMELRGFRNRENGIGLAGNASQAGLQIMLEQYSNEPAWLDEYYEEKVPPGLKDIIHSTYNREPPTKWAADGIMRQIRTSALVTGETTCTRAATRSRFPDILIDKNRRRLLENGERVNHMDWFEKHREWLVLLGRKIMRERKNFVDICLQCLQSWRQGPMMKRMDDRAKLIYGICYAAGAAAALLFDSHGPEELEGYKKFLVQRCAESEGKATAQVNANKFWEQLISAFERGVFGETLPEQQRFFKVTKKEAGHPPLVAEHAAEGAGLECVHCRMGGWKSYFLHLSPNGILDLMRKDLRQQGETLALNRADLRDQLATKPYWETKPDSRQRFGRGAASSACWSIALDRHELGYRLVADDELWLAVREAQEGDRELIGMLGRDWGDPRKGSLFKIVDGLEREGDGNG